MCYNVCLIHGRRREDEYRAFRRRLKIRSLVPGHAGLLLALLSMALSGCCMFIPMPEHGLTSGHGEITEADTGFLEVGKTTREEILLRFGEPSCSLNDGSIFVYDWSVVKAYWFVAVGYYFSGHWADGFMDKEYQVVLEFDEQGLLKRHERMAPGRFRAKGEAFSANHLQVPPGKSAIFVYWPKRFLGSAVHVPVSVDASHLTDLQNGGFALLIVDPGMHTASYNSRANPVFSTLKSFSLKAQTLKVGANEKTFLRVGLQCGWDYCTVTVDVMPEKEALTEIMDTRRSAVVRRPLGWHISHSAP
jgi:hypothetical protein